MKLKSTILFIILIIFTTGAGAESLTLTGSIMSPTLAGNTITDHSGFKYSAMADGMYKIEYNNKITYFAFGLSGTVNANNFIKLSSDYSWSRSVTPQANGYTATAISTTGEWQTEFTFTDRKTKILNKVTNPLGSPITKAKFYYLFSVSTGDIIKYQGETHIIPASPDIYRTGDLNKQIPQVIINDHVLFDFQDIIRAGFNITDFYIVPASSLGFVSSSNVVAIGFTKGDGQINPGQTVIIDPSLEWSGGSGTLYGNYTYEYVNLTNGAVLNIAAYNGTTGTGTLNLTVTNSINIDSTSSINGDARGNLGGAEGGYGGSGLGGGTNGQQDGCGSYGTGGGGGSYGTVGGMGGYVNSCGLTPGSGGSIYGTTSELDIDMGSGAGGSGKGGSNSAGNPGGAALSIYADTINIFGTITNKGGAGASDGSPGGGGGASGGGILLHGTTFNISGATLDTSGGAGGAGGTGSAQAGGGGRVKIFYRTISNTSTTITSGTTYYGLLNTAPTVPVLHSPVSGYVFNSTRTIPLEWLQSTDVDGDSLTYDWAVDGVTQDTGISANSTSTVLSEGSHNWSVRAYDGIDYSDWATVGTFSIALIPNIITDPICTHGSNYITCTWTDPTDANFDHVYITNMTGINNTWDSNVTAGVQTKTWSNMPKGTYSYKAQSVTTLGAISSNFTWINSTVNNYSFVFSGQALSLTSIDQSSGTETISVYVNDSDGNITNMTVTLTYFGVPFVYNMTHGSGDYWSYAFKSGSVGAYYVASFNATDESGDSNGTTWGQSFIVTPVVGGGSPGGGGSPSSGTVATPTATTTAAPHLSTINLQNMRYDDMGQTILYGGVIIGGFMMVYAFINNKKTTTGTLIWGLIMFVVSGYGLGWVA